MKNNELVILVHGFNKNEKDMYPLKQYLTKLGYDTVTVNLPLLFHSFEFCTRLFKEKVLEIEQLKYYRKIHFVGHSMGGLIIRHFLGHNIVSNLGRCVFIATPNGGTKLADLAQEFLGPMVEIFKPLKSLGVNNLHIPRPLNDPKPDMGLIAGNKNNLFLGIFLSKESDGRVEVESVKLKGAKDFVVENYGHKEIHHKIHTAQLVDNFLQTGAFIKYK